MKDAYYFSHDSNAKDDPKCVMLIEQLGLEGYGMYWILIETLRDQPNYKYPVVLIPAIARRYNTTAEKMKTVVHAYGLFEVDEKEFFSISLMNRMCKMEKLRNQKVEAGKKSAEKRLLLSGRSALVERTLNEIPTNVEQLKESKVKEKKLKESKEYIPYAEIVNYFNYKVGSRYSISSKSTQQLIKARFNEKFTFDDFKTVIDKKCLQWLEDPVNAQYLRPETLFSNKFEGYLNQRVVAYAKNTSNRKTDPNANYGGNTVDYQKSYDDM